MSSEKVKGFSFTGDSRRISLMRRSDRNTLVLFIFLFIVSAAAYIYMTFIEGRYTVYAGMPILAVPFFVVGLIFYVVNRRYYAGLFIIVLSVIAFFVLPYSVLFILYLLVCAEGVATMVEIIQRMIFYRIMSTVERVNIKKKMTFMDRVVVFFFNIPVDLDTRNLLIDRNVSRNKLPWKDMAYTMMLALLFCMFIWIYMFLNPSFSPETHGVPIYTFTIILYLSMAVMPWTIFSSLNVRIGTEYRDFSLYSGFLETFKRMFLPVFAAIIFLGIALTADANSLYYIGMSLLMIVAMIVFTSVMYYTSNEMVVVNDILDKWRDFQPTEMYSGYSPKEARSSLDDGIPGTPRRDPSECFLPDLRSRSRR